VLAIHRPPELLSRKIEDEEIKAQIEKLKSGLVKAQDTNNKKQETKRMENKSDPDKYQDVNRNPKSLMMILPNLIFGLVQSRHAIR
jgi:hypothetical protein